MQWNAIEHILVLMQNVMNISLLQAMSCTQRDNIFIQAAFSKDVWSVAVAVMNKFEIGQLRVKS